MNVKQLQQSLIYLIKKNKSDREDLKKLIREDADSAKYILAQIDKYKGCELQIIWETQEFKKLPPLE